ncbi:pol protein [Cucumis melo var. makuwa]|uniref:Pol protein n=2 Tax=Cucumis melo var. makuwa TaxID=1194695 RepID=A0A5D3C3Y2_CUCMM|nr:pol protein [Cucumis melo var. makuwa]
MLGDDVTVEQYDAEFYMLFRFSPDVVRDKAARTDKFVSVDMSLHERVDPSKAVERESTLGRKRKAELQPTIAPQRNLRSGTVVLPKVISAMKVSKLLNQGTWSILDSVVDIREPKVSLSSEPVSQTLFLYLELLIEWPPAELKELKVQLQEFLDKGYLQLRIRDSDIPNIAFHFIYGHYEFIVMSFGLINSSATEAEYEEHLYQVLETIQANKLYVKFSKCYYRRFVEDFSRITNPLTQLTRNETPFVWSPTCESSFQELKLKLVTALVFTMSDGSESFVIYSDAFKKGLGKANVVANALSRKVSHSATLITEQIPLLRNFERVEIAVLVGEVTSQLTQLTLKGYTVIWVVVDRLTKSAHFTLGKSTYIANTMLDFSTTFHPQTDGQIERLNQILEDMLRACVLKFSGSWDSHLHLMEFAYNNNYQATIGMTPFEALYGHELVQATNAAIKKIRARILTAQSRQKSYADERLKDLEFDVGDIVFLKVAPMKGVLRFEKKRKLSPRFVGPFEILEHLARRPDTCS